MVGLIYLIKNEDQEGHCQGDTDGEEDPCYGLPTGGARNPEMITLFYTIS